MPERSQGQSRESRPSTGRHEERYGGYTPGKSSSELQRPKGLRNPPPSRPKASNSAAPSEVSAPPPSQR